MPRFCIVSHFAFGALNGGTHGHLGGVERQTTLVARWLAGRGHDVSLITWDEGQEEGLCIDRVKVLKLCRRSDGWPGVRFVHPRWTSLNAALGRADAELYYQNCAEHATGQVAWWCRRNGRRFVYSVASNPDCDPRLPELHSLRERLLYRYGLRHADCVIVQTEQQRRVLFEGFALKSSRLPMPCPGPSDLEFTSSKAFPEPFRVAWVGRISPVKRLEMMLEVAEKLPEIQFEVAGKPDESDPAYAAALLGRAAKIKNLKVNGPIPMDAMNGFYRKMSLLCCTSAYEGFPNTFLEAWSHGLPVVSTVDPDNLIAERNLGAWAPSTAGIAAAIRRFRESPADRQSASANSRRYYSENHSVEPAMLKFEKLFLETLNGGGRS